MLGAPPTVQQLINVCNIEADSTDKDLTMLGEAGSRGEKILTQYDWDWKSTNNI